MKLPISSLALALATAATPTAIAAPPKASTQGFFAGTVSANEVSFQPGTFEMNTTRFDDKIVIVGKTFGKTEFAMSDCKEMRALADSINQAPELVKEFRDQAYLEMREIAQNERVKFKIDNSKGQVLGSDAGYMFVDAASKYAADKTIANVHYASHLCNGIK